MRLIDADKLCMHLADLQLSNAPDERDSEEVQRVMKSNYDCLELLIKMLNKQPTAYDVDKVVEELKTTKSTVLDMMGVARDSAIDRAIEIVKAGETNE